jgi:tetratricopeptide (TPR) repeat protein
MKFRLILICLVFSFAVFAQKTSEGDKYFNAKQFSKAKSIYENLLKQRPKDALYNYRYARCCYEMKDFDNAITHFEMSGNKYPLRDLYLGELYFNNYKFDESVMAYQTYLATLKPDDKSISDIQNKIKRAVTGAELINKVNDIAIVDSIVVNKSDFLRFYKFSNELGTLTQEPLKLTAKKTVDKIKYMTQRQDRVYFSDSIHGQMNLFTSYKLLDSWSEPASISKIINTPANENYPFLLLDGVTLYFASDGDNSLGGYDIFVTRYMSGTDSYLKPENVGFPFNSPFNDYMMVIDEQRKLGWFASDRYQPTGKVIIYTFIPNDLKQIVRSEDKEYIRRVAQLKQYRKAKITHTNTQDTIEEPIVEQKKQIHFVINDSTIYTSLDDFKSPDAKRLWVDLHKLKQDLKSKKTQLEVFRFKFSETSDLKSQEDLKKSIPELEAYLLKDEKQIESKTTDIRNAEIIFLRKTDK